MMDFKKVLKVDEEGMAENPFAGQKGSGDWVAGQISVEFLNTNFGKYETTKEMKNATESEALKKYFDWLKEEGKLN